MPQTKTQKAIFGIIMSFLMVYGMETYNRAIQSRMGSIGICCIFD